MKGYARSYILGSILIAAAFVTLFVPVKALPFRGDIGSWLFFIGGALLVIVGWREQNKKE